MAKPRTPRAIDLYSGIGGWALGLRMAGIDTAASYEWWPEANATHAANLGTTPNEVDIRALEPSGLPKGQVDFVVGSPPCTQFSYANRGGNGDIADGLRDVYKFLEIVDDVAPRYWVMENVPRVLTVLRSEAARRRGRLKSLLDQIDVLAIVDMSEFGLPQRRRRAIAGSFPIELLMSYRSRSNALTLRDVIKSLAAEPVRDPLYGFELPREQLTEDEMEPLLDSEEVRMNREAKQFHPVYNVMSFPDRLDRPARTVTALCTRISRESTVISDDRSGSGLRRLTLRERATLQGFPITYQLFGQSYTSKLKLIGNALPPLFAYYVGKALLESSPGSVSAPSDLRFAHRVPASPPPTKPSSPSRRFTATRRFRAAVPNLRFGSGMRFDLSNEFIDGNVGWKIRFFFGPSKTFRVLEADRKLLTRVRRALDPQAVTELDRLFAEFARSVCDLSGHDLQATWTRTSDGLSPYDLVDRLGDLAREIYEWLPIDDDLVTQLLASVFDSGSSQEVSLASSAKVASNSRWVVSGLLLASWFNSRALKSAGAKRAEPLSR